MNQKYEIRKFTQILFGYKNANIDFSNEKLYNIIAQIIVP